MIRSKRFPEKKDFVIRGFVVKCEKCLLRLDWEQQDGGIRAIKVKPCPKCTTVVTKRVGVAELRELLLPPPSSPRVERLIPRFTPLWLRDLEAMFAAFTFTVRELKRGYLLTPTARQELEEKLGENREVLITAVLALSSTAPEDSLFEEEEQVEGNGGGEEEGSCNCND